MFGKILAVGLSAAAVAGLATPAWSQEKQVVIYTQANAPAAPKLDDLPLKDSVSQYGMTWTFDKPARVGQFVNGDFYVVGPVTITEITPKPLYGAEIPANQLDPHGQGARRKMTASATASCSIRRPCRKSLTTAASGTGFDPSLIQKLPVSMKPGDSLVSTISMPVGLSSGAAADRQRAGEIRGDEDASPVKDAAVLTCVAEPLPPDAFRPAFCDRTQKIYLARNLKRELLPDARPPRRQPEDHRLHPLHAAPVAQHVLLRVRGAGGEHALVRPRGRPRRRQRGAAALRELHAAAERTAPRQPRPGRH